MAIYMFFYIFSGDGWTGHQLYYLKLNPWVRCILASSMQRNTITDITNIAYQQIKGNYYWAQYGDFKVIMDKSTGYINATKLCLLATNKEGITKKFKYWMKNTASTDLINEVSSLVEISTNDLLVKSALSNELKGTYAHPDLIPHIAAWASPVFAVKVSKIINAQLVREYKETIRVKDDKIDNLERKIDEQTRQINELLTETRESRKEIRQVHEELECTTTELEGLSADNMALTQKVDSALKRLDIATEDRAPKPANAKYTHAYLVYHKPNTLSYRVVRRQLDTLAKGINMCTDAGYTTCSI